MPYTRILTVQDISCVGQCSATVALPILAACGHETCVLPTAVLSTHTGGFTSPAFRDLTEDLPGIFSHWQREGISFDAVCTGYLGSIRQIRIISDLLSTLVRPHGIRIVDPAIADNGKLYKGFDNAFVDAMKSLCTQADIILPNLTEACLLTGTPYREVYDESFIHMLLNRLHEMGCRTVVLTGVGYTPGTTGVTVSRGTQRTHYSHEKIAKGFSGTGDAFAAAFTGLVMRGKTPEDAASISADFICECIRHTAADSAHWYGVKYAPALPRLISRL
jgi:pyridoxine kinase